MIYFAKLTKKVSLSVQRELHSEVNEPLMTTKMKRQLILISILSSTLLFSCNKLENTLQGGWNIEKVYYHNKPVVYDLYTTRFDLSSNNTCELPISISSLDENKLDGEKGLWKAYTSNNVSYLQIQTKNKIFCRKFRILNIREEPAYLNKGELLKMTLIADSIKIKCAKVPN